MYELHRTKDGKKLFISQMDDRHLSNTIMLILKNIEDAKRVASQEIPLTKFQKTIYKMNDRNIERKAEKMIVNLSQKLYPYLAEAMIRGLDFKDRMRVVFERSSADPVVTLNISDETQYLIEHNDIEDVDWEDR